MDKDDVTALNVQKVGNIPSARLNEELAFVDEPFWYYVIEATGADDRTSRREGGIAWLEESGRAIVLWNEETFWTRAETPQDAADRWLEDRIETPPRFQ